ncbi:hypothetical protein TrRE_jg10986 [Triparma retinervis]|uniref:Uncharacterized protein n=1 Tax=Triparma retinervis TaxID=2557542 RepID=A0A9W7AH84_9STRA|nr:hypothetical protein TrRE_jg10986 [Triparma retinervis]
MSNPFFADIATLDDSILDIPDFDHYISWGLNNHEDDTDVVLGEYDEESEVAWGWEEVSIRIRGFGDEAKVTVVLSDSSVDELLNEAFFFVGYVLWKVEIQHIRHIEKNTFESAHNLRHVKLHSKVPIMPGIFADCSSLEVLARASGFELGDNDNNDPTNAIARYLRWRCDMDANRGLYMEVFKTTMTMLELCCAHLSPDGNPDHNKPVRATPGDKIFEFLATEARDLSGLVLSFVTGEKRGGGGDLRDAGWNSLRDLAIDFELVPKGGGGKAGERRAFWRLTTDEQGNFVKG